MNVHDHKRLPVEYVLMGSGMFTQVEPDWLAEHDGHVTFVNKTRGVVVKVNRIEGGAAAARVFLDAGGETYYSSGWYSCEELASVILPIMRSDAAWDKVAEVDGDLSIALDFAHRA